MSRIYQRTKGFFTKVPAQIGLLLVAIVAVAAFVLPSALKIQAVDCPNPPTHAVLNYWPVTYNPSGELCKDYPAMVARTQSTAYPASASEASQGISAKDGDIITVRYYIHNGAATNLNPADTTARNVRVNTAIDGSTGSSHSLSFSFHGDNTNTVSGALNIRTNANEHLVLVPGSGELWNAQAQQIASGFDVTNYSIGDMISCFEHSVFVRFQIRVVAQSYTYPTPSYNTPYATPYNTPYATPYNTPYSTPYSYPTPSYSTPYATPYTYPTPAPSLGCIDVVKETFNTTGQALTPVTQFSFKLDGGTTVQNNGDGKAHFSNVSLGSHTITETSVSGWNQISVAPANGVVQVTAGSTCAVVTFKNQQVVSYATPYAYPTPAPTNTTLYITKDVRDVTKNELTFSNKTNASAGDTVEYQIVVGNNSTNSNSVSAKNVTITDTVGSIAGLTVFGNLDTSKSVTGSIANTVVVGDLAPGQQVTIKYRATVGAVTTTATYTNTATAVATNAPQVSDTAQVMVVTSNLELSKKAWNDTKNKDATSVSADREDYITYTLSAKNTGSGVAKGFVISDDLSGVLPFADITNKNDATVTGNTITFPSVDINPGDTASKTFQVRIKFHLNQEQSFVLKNTYGNTISILVPGQTILVAPKTGAAGFSAITFSGLLTAAGVLLHKRKRLVKFIWT